jgi:predicted transcriptional regulator
METPHLGDQELEVLTYIASHAPVTAREVAEKFAEERNLARTTILTVIERLRKKGYLTRRRREGVYEYVPRVAQSEVMNGMVRQFIQRTLGGSVSPVVAYLSQSREISETELDELQALVDQLKREKRDDG